MPLVGRDDESFARSKLFLSYNKSGYEVKQSSDYQAPIATSTANLSGSSNPHTVKLRLFNELIKCNDEKENKDNSRCCVREFG